MNNTPQIWGDGYEPFFRITSSCFSPSFCYGASVLLASYDPDDELASSHSLAEPGLRHKPERHFIYQPST